MRVLALSASLCESYRVPRIILGQLVERNFPAAICPPPHCNISIRPFSRIFTGVPRRYHLAFAVSNGLPEVAGLISSICQNTTFCTITSIQPSLFIHSFVGLFCVTSCTVSLPSHRLCVRTCFCKPNAKIHLVHTAPSGLVSIPDHSVYFLGWSRSI